MDNRKYIVILKLDEYGYIHNDEQNYIGVAMALMNNGKALVSWTDEEGTVYDILFCNGGSRITTAYLQRGIRGTDLFVSVIGKGCFSFDGFKDTGAGYYGEKLGFERSGVTIEKLAEFINGVRRNLVKLKEDKDEVSEMQL